MYRRTLLVLTWMALAAWPVASDADDFIGGVIDWVSTDTYLGFSTTAGVQSSDASTARLAASLTEATVLHALDVRDGGIGWRLYGGKRLHPRLTLEGGYVSTGRVRLVVDADADDPEAFLEQLVRNTPVAPGGFMLDAVSELTFADLGVRTGWAYQAYLVGRAGVFAWRSETRFTHGGTTFRHSDDGIDLHVGLGAGWWFTDNLAARLEWERYGATTTMRTISLGVIYNF